MDKYKELLAVFDDILKESKDYNIAHIYHVGYAALIGLRQDSETEEFSVIIDDVFTSPEKMAENLLQNWRWQWFYKNRDFIGEKDFVDIRQLDRDIPDAIKDDYFRDLHEVQSKVDLILGKK